MKATSRTLSLVVLLVLVTASGHCAAWRLPERIPEADSWLLSGISGATELFTIERWKLPYDLGDVFWAPSPPAKQSSTSKRW